MTDRELVEALIASVIRLANEMGKPERADDVLSDLAEQQMIDTRFAAIVAEPEPVNPTAWRSMVDHYRSGVPIPRPGSGKTHLYLTMLQAGTGHRGGYR